MASLSTSQIADMAGNMHASAMRLYRLIENFLIYAQVQIALGDQQRLAGFRAQCTYNPASSIERVMRDRAGLLGREDDLRFALQDAEQLRIGDDYLRKIADELVENACKFSARGTPIEVTTAIDGDRYRLSIRDEGRGMSREQIARIGGIMQFDRQLYEQQGTGVGLSLVERLLYLYQGALQIESEVGKGTTVTALFLLRTAEA